MIITKSLRRGAFAASLCTLAVVASACSSSASSGGTTSAGTGPSTGGSTTGKSYTLAGTAGIASDAYWISLQCGGTTAAKAAGSTITWHATTSSDNAQVVQVTQAALLGNPDGVVLSPNGSVSMTPYLTQLKSSNTPVIETNSTNGTGYYQSVESPEQDPSVKAIARLIAKNTGGTGTVAILAGIAAVPVINYRWQPLVAELKSVAPKLNVLPVRYDNFDSTTTASTLSSEMAANPDLKAVWVTSGPEGIGAASAVKAAGKAGTVGVYSYDAEPNQVQALRDGTITALLAQSPYKIGETAVTNLIAALNKRGSSTGPVGTASPASVITPTKILTKANIDAPSSKPYEYSSTCSA